MTNDAPTPPGAPATAALTPASQNPENQQTAEENQPPAEASITEICHHLIFELENPNPYSGALERQVTLLDRLLYAVMRRDLRDQLDRGAFQDSEIEKALRIQKQCLDTCKAYHTIDYMQALAEAARRNIPLPRRHDRQTDEF